jgi:hypothetical protein
VLAVLKITIAGVKYMLSDVVTSKESAKKDIQGALFGLLIVLAAVIILNTINPSLSRFAIFYTGVTGELIQGDGASDTGGGTVSRDGLTRPTCEPVGGRPQIPQLRDGGWTCADLFTRITQSGLTDDARARLQALIDNDETPPDIAARAREILDQAINDTIREGRESGGGGGGGGGGRTSSCTPVNSFVDPIGGTCPDGYTVVMGEDDGTTFVSNCRCDY